MSDGRGDAVDAGRREAMTLVARVGAGLLAGALVCVDEARARGGSLPAARDAARIAWDEFHALSRILTDHDALDETLSRAIFEQLRVEPWGPEHMASVYARVRSLLAGDGAREVRDPSLFPDGERWFVSHVLVTWYTGVYYHETGNRALGFEHALMHELLLDLRPVPTMCDREPGFWAAPPTRRPRIE